MTVSKVHGGRGMVQSVEDFAATNGLSRAYVYKLIKEGKLTARKLGRLTRIYEEDSRAFFRGLPTKPAA